MKCMHLADLHLGKKLGDISLLEDQAHALHQLLVMAESEKVDAVLVAGDIYQKSAPSAEAMALWSDFVTALEEKGILLFAISGNHDSDKRVACFSNLLRSRGIYISDCFEGLLQTVVLKDAFGEVAIHLLPFVRPSQVRHLFPEETINNYEDAMRVIFEKSPIDKNRRNLLLCHQFVTGAATCDSEEFSVGGLDNIGAEVFDDFDYVALGHIHGPQSIGRESLRYAGSLLKYSLSEAKHEKSVTLVTLGEKGDVQIETKSFAPLHDLRSLQGSLEEIMAMDYSEDYVHITVTDEIVPPDACVTVTTRFPNLLKFSVSNSKTKEDTDLSALDQKLEDKSFEALFSDFFKLQNSGEAPADDYLEVLREILLEMEAEKE